MCAMWGLAWLLWGVLHVSWADAAATPVAGSWWVSSYGRIWSPQGFVGYGTEQASGYLAVKMFGQYFYVHRVVAAAFLGPPPSEKAWLVHHKDNNISNNDLSNLEYVTSSQNNRHALASGMRPSGGPKRSKPVEYQTAGSTRWIQCPSIARAALQIAVSASAISAACKLEGGGRVRGHQIRLQAPCGAEPLAGEEWKQMRCPISGEEVPGRMVSSRGRVMMCSGRVHGGYLRQDGYLSTGYSFASRRRNQRAHRLVAYTFFGPPPSPRHSHVNHKDGDKQNNAAHNLEYVTPAENRAHYLENRAAQQHPGKCRAGAKPVWSRACNSNEEWTWHPSMQSAAKALGVHQRVCLAMHPRQASTRWRLRVPGRRRLSIASWGGVEGGGCSGIGGRKDEPHGPHGSESCVIWMLAADQHTSANGTLLQPNGFTCEL